MFFQMSWYCIECLKFDWKVTRTRRYEKQLERRAIAAWPTRLPGPIILAAYCVSLGYNSWQTVEEICEKKRAIGYWFTRMRRR